MFSPQQRQVFGYHDGQRERYADPLRVRRLLQKETGGELWHVWALANGVQQALGAVARFDRQCREAAEQGLPAPDEASRPEGPTGEMFDAEEALLDAARVAFDLPPFDPDTGTGATEEVCRDCLAAWLDFVSKKNDEDGGSPTSSSAAAAGPPDCATPMPDTLLSS